jgi:hypothetical protein
MKKEEETPIALAQSSADLDYRPSINFHGLPGSGKTWAALQLSKDWPKDPFGKKKVELTDIISVGWDREWVIGLLETCVSVKYVIDPRKLMTSPRKGEKKRPYAEDILSAQEMILNEIYRIVDADINVNFLMDDTLTRMDKLMLDYYSQPGKMPTSEKTGSDNTQAYYRLMLSSHSYYANERSKIGNLCCLNVFHSKDLVVEPKHTQKQKARSYITKMGKDEVSFVPAITGQAVDLYTGDATWEFGVVDTKNQKGWEYTLYPITSPLGHRGKNRLKKTLPERLSTGELRQYLAKLRIL